MLAFKRTGYCSNPSKGVEMTWRHRKNLAMINWMLKMWKHWEERKKFMKVSIRLTKMLRQSIRKYNRTRSKGNKS